MSKEDMKASPYLKVVPFRVQSTTDEEVVFSVKSNLPSQVWQRTSTFLLDLPDSGLTLYVMTLASPCMS